MRYLLILLLFTSCNESTRISTENALVMFTAQGELATRLQKTQLTEDQFKIAGKIKQISVSGHSALIPVRNMLKIDAEFFGMTDAKEVRPDVLPDELMEDTERSLGIIDARTKRANEEVASYGVGNFINNNLAKTGGGIMAALIAMASAYVGINKISSLKKVALNSMRYAKDMEVLAKKDPENEVSISDARKESQLDQNKHSVNGVMDKLLSQLKQERTV